MKILRHAAVTLAAFAALSAAAFTLDLPVETINGKDYYVYRVVPKETVYSITRKLGITRDQLIEANPAVADGLRAGETLLFPVTEPKGALPKIADIIEQSEQESPAKEAPQEPQKSLESQDSQSSQESQSSQSSQSSQEPAQAPEEPAQAPQESTQAAAQEPADTVSIAIILPFMLENQSITKSAENFTNFYKGFLLAANQLTAQSQTPVSIAAYDTEASAEKIAELIASPAVRNASYIIAPDDAVAINSIVAVTDSTDAMVLNLFAVKNDGYLTHESLMQGNISHDSMYATAIDGLCRAAAGKKVIMLNATDIPAEKAKFTTELTAKLVTSGIPYEKIDYTGKLTEQDLAQLPAGKDYLFIPTSHSREALMRILPALEDFKAMNSSATLFGYPEWIVLQGDIKDRLHKLNTTIYSRFAADPASDKYKTVAAAYEETYGAPLERSIPNQALLGFDAASWILRAAEAGAEEPYTGVQNSFKFKEIDGGGFENTSLYFITFAPEGAIEVTLL